MYNQTIEYEPTDKQIGYTLLALGLTLITTIYSQLELYSTKDIKEEPTTQGIELIIKGCD